MTNPTFRRKHKIRFSECDPAGIVFFPQYFVLFNDLIESWVDELLPDGYHGVICTQRVGMPTVHLETDFKAISKMGDEVWLALDVERLGQKSLTLSWACTGVDGVVRMAARQTIVTTSLDTHQSIAIPDGLRTAIERSAMAARNS
ncbi:Thioesterase superfamily protein [Paraburkholderia ribeironis]|uniref:Thioesterase superfamily protein n=1 Tax=Paraburkholderia ribeironis TaxID=1247936 RepID=A0A1N7S2D4_9BURK|nr:thioesterase family protein [Paraburkholderia ribeironis]SIT41555.1 Thioesterase superfamily protein [Paraburkholderia ribeironis]